MNHDLKFPDEATAITAMPQFRIDDQWILSSHTHASVRGFGRRGK